MGVAGPVCQDQKNASPKAGVFRSEGGYLRRSQATEASDAFWVYSSIWSKLRYLYVSAACESICLHASKYSSGEGSLPLVAETAASSAEARYTLAPLPRRLGPGRRFS